MYKLSFERQKSEKPSQLFSRDEDSDCAPYLSPFWAFLGRLYSNGTAPPPDNTTKQVAQFASLQKIKPVTSTKADAFSLAEDCPMI